VTRAGRFASWPSREAPVSATTLAREMAAVAQVLLAPPPFPDGAARGNGQPVIVIPGFLSPDATTARLRDFLARQNFLAHPWTCGLNVGPMPRVITEVERQVRETADATGKPVCLIGVSLGGTIAREVAKSCLGPVARVITLVSPIHLPVATPLAPLAQAASLLWDMEELEALRAIAEPPPVPVTAIISRDDGVIDWRASVPAPSEMVEVVEVSGPHMTVCSNPQVQHIVADRLAWPSPTRR
jgi:pimeloyl-ACP methyl ester carboxylesterase